MRGLLTTLCFLITVPAIAASGQIFDVDFNELSPGLAPTQPVTEPLPLMRPTNVVLDFPGSGDTIEIVPAAGDLTDQPVLLDARPGGISWGAFLTPDVYSTGQFSVSWDSLVQGLPVDGDREAFQGVVLVTRTGDPAMASTLRLFERWEMRYAPKRALEVSDAMGTRTAGEYVVGQADHFDLDFNLDSGAWELAVNGAPLLDGFLLPPFEFGGTVFMTNGREQTADPPALAMDNLLVELVEPGDLPTGDYNGNGMVEQADLDLVLLHWGQQTPPVPSGWNHQLPIGAVDQAELDGVLLNWGSTQIAATAPEPTTGAMVALLTAFSLMAWRRKATN